jgi:NTE family protein
MAKNASTSRPQLVSDQTKPRPADHDCILALQGGGALGAYQAGVFEALCENHAHPTWVAGISIGAINAALIAGTPVAQRVERLREFWSLVSSSAELSALPLGISTREALNEASATQAMLFGVPGFFAPRVPPAPLQPRGTMQAISYYDTTLLRHTLERLVNFDLINKGHANKGHVRLSVGAVNVRTGNLKYFDSAKQPIDARHIMASGALPPGFAPVEIDGEYYWDGGLLSNTPLQYVLEQPAKQHREVFQVDLFPAKGKLPTTLTEVTGREKDIRFSSRTRLNTTHAIDEQRLAKAAQRLLTKLPAELRDDPDAQTLSNLRSPPGVDVMHLIYRSKRYESQSKDYEFSRISVDEHWASGLADMNYSLQDPRWVNRQPNADGIREFDPCRDRPAAKKGKP